MCIFYVTGDHFLRLLKPGQSNSILNNLIALIQYRIRLAIVTYWILDLLLHFTLHFSHYLLASNITVSKFVVRQPLEQFELLLLLLYLYLYVTDIFLFYFAGHK